MLLNPSIFKIQNRAKSINVFDNLIQTFSQDGPIHFEKDFYFIDELFIFLTQVTEYISDLKTLNDKKKLGGNKKTRRHKSRGHKSRLHKSRVHKSMHGGGPIFMIVVCVMILCSAFGQLQITRPEYDKYIESIQNMPSPALHNFVAPGKCASNAAVVAGFIDMEQWKQLNKGRFISYVANDSKIHPSKSIAKIVTNRIPIKTNMSDIKSKIISQITPFLLPEKVTIGQLTMVTKKRIPGTKHVIHGSAGNHAVVLAVETDINNNPISLSIIDVGRRLGITNTNFVFTGTVIDGNTDDFTNYLNEMCHIDDADGYATSINVLFSKMQKIIDFEKNGIEIAETEKKLLKDMSFGTVTTQISKISKILCNIGLQIHKLLYYLFSINLLQDSSI